MSDPVWKTFKWTHSRQTWWWTGLWEDTLQNKRSGTSIAQCQTSNPQKQHSVNLQGKNNSNKSCESFIAIQGKLHKQQQKKQTITQPWDYHFHIPAAAEPRHLHRRELSTRHDLSFSSSWQYCWRPWAPTKPSQPRFETPPHGASERVHERREEEPSWKGSSADVRLRDRTYQHRGRHEEVIKGVVQQVDAGGRVQVCVAHQLAGEQRLPGAAAQEAAHLAVGHVQSVGQHLRTQTPECKAQMVPRGSLTQ